MRDLDYINPRPPRSSSALPPDVRAKLLGRRCSSEPKENFDEHRAIYQGAANAEAKVGKSGAGTNWQNKNGHAFIRRGSGVPMSKRASRKVQMEGRGAELIAMQSEQPAVALDAGGGDSGGYAGRSGSARPPVIRRTLSKRSSSMNPASRESPSNGGGGGGYSANNGGNGRGDAGSYAGSSGGSRPTSQNSRRPPVAPAC